MALGIRVSLKIETVTIGALPENGGSRSCEIRIGGQSAMPFLFKDGEIPNKPVTAYEIWDVTPKRWGAHLRQKLSEFWNNPIKWAEYLIEKCSARLILLRLMGPGKEYSLGTIPQTLDLLKEFLEKIRVPLIILGCGESNIDRELMPAVAEVTRGERLLLGTAQHDDFREITSVCREYGHNLITESPIDINLAKQANILVQEMGLSPDRVVMYASTGALGYGLEYAYSIMERSRMAGLTGDKYMNRPQIALVGQETWRTKEAGLSVQSGIEWETVTAIAYLHAGADIAVVRHPETGRRLEEYIDSFI